MAFLQKKNLFKGSSFNRHFRDELCGRLHGRESRNREVDPERSGIGPRSAIRNPAQRQRVFLR